MVEELNPTYGNLIGRVEHIAQMGTLVTDFLLIKPGALHAANGGYLLLDARKLLLSPFAWEALKRAIKAREIHIEQPSEATGFSLISTQSLDPEPIPLDVRVVLFGDRELYYLLAAYDPDFAGLFKVQADFDDTIARSSENDNAYARVIASIVKEHGAQALRCRRRRPHHRRGRAAGRRPREAVDRDRPHRRHRARGRLLVEPGQAQDDHQAGRGARHRGADPARRPAARPGAGDDRARRRAGRHRRRPGRPDQRAVGAPARQLLVRAAEPHHRPRARRAPAASSTSSARPSSAGRCTPRA